MIGIMGGAFDPVHFGHLRPALEVAESLSLSAVRFIPAKLPALKDQPQTSAEHRLQMVALAIENESGFILDDRELKRQGISYTVDTLDSLKADFLHEPLVFILGADAFKHFKKWKHWEEILQLAHLVISHRPGHQIGWDDWPESRWAKTVEDLAAKDSGLFYSLAVTQLEISSTAIRQRLGQGLSARYLAPEPVLRYIEKNSLYLTL